MDANEIIVKYYSYANAGLWEQWLDLFDDNIIMDEQLAGHTEGLPALRTMMKGFGEANTYFANVPRHLVINADGSRAAVVSHLTGRPVSLPGQSVEADVVNYFEFGNGKITYFSNYHDTRPWDIFKTA